MPSAMTDSAIAVSPPGNGAPAIPKAPPTTMPPRNAAGAANGRVIVIASTPTVTIASTWSRPRIGWVRPSHNPLIPPPTWASSALIDAPLVSPRSDRSKPPSYPRMPPVHLSIALEHLASWRIALPLLVVERQSRRSCRRPLLPGAGVEDRRHGEDATQQIRPEQDGQRDTDRAVPVRFGLEQMGDPIHRCEVQRLDAHADEDCSRQQITQTGAFGARKESQ